MDEELIPVDKVLEDMYNPDGGIVAIMARTYYYDFYATPEEQKEMDREDKLNSAITFVFLFGYTVLLCIAAISMY